MEQNNFNLIRVASALPEVFVGEPMKNAEEILECIKEAERKEVDIIVFPELCITGYTCGDLFFNSKLHDEEEKALKNILEVTRNCNLVIILGYLTRDMINSAIILQQGRIIGLVGKRNLPSYNEFYEKRWFKESQDEPQVFELRLGKPGYTVKFGVEICEDLWSPNPPSVELVRRGAEIIFNLSASNELVGKSEYLEELIEQQSARLICGYVYSSCGPNESTQDVVYLGKQKIYENGKNLTVYNSGKVCCNDIDLDIIRHDRNKNTSFRSFYDPSYETTIIPGVSHESRKTVRYYPAKNLYDKSVDNMKTIKRIQVEALKRRLGCTGLNPVIGISGGTDSTWALIICNEAVKELGGNFKIIGVTMPGFATSERTLNNSKRLMEVYGIPEKVIPISSICLEELKALGHDCTTEDITYENVQARTRTQILMNLANKEGGLVIGTGDLSELALGWCTYNADHMSMYGVNVGVPKSLVKSLINSYSILTPDDYERSILQDILNTPVSPELTGSGAEGEKAQVTEDKIGPYVVHDFFLHYFLRYGFSPEKILWIAEHSDLMNDYTVDEIKGWLRVFITRFFTQQFKRSCLPDGPKIGSISLSPRGDLRMPSDASYKEWINNIK